MLVSRRDVEISWGDCDLADIVYFPNYFRWFDTSTSHHFATAGLPKRELIRRYNVVGFPMVDTSAKFHVPSKHGEMVTIETRFPRFGHSSFDVEHRLLRGETLAVEGFEKRVLVQKKETGDGMRSFAIPQEIIALFSD